MLQPKKVKHRKWHKGRSPGVETRGASLAYGSFGLKALEARWITARQIEAARRAITHYITRRPPEVTMGGGKGSVEFYVFPVRPGRILFEMDGVTREIAEAALRKAAHKLPMKTRFIASKHQAL